MTTHQALNSRSDLAANNQARAHGSASAETPGSVRMTCSRHKPAETKKADPCGSAFFDESMVV
jgi:hypothetical protein